MPNLQSLLVYCSRCKSTLLNSNSIWKEWMKSHFVEMPLSKFPFFKIFFIQGAGYHSVSHELEYKEACSTACSKVSV